MTKEIVTEEIIEMRNTKIIMEEKIVEVMKEGIKVEVIEMIHNISLKMVMSSVDIYLVTMKIENSLM